MSKPVLAIDVDITTLASDQAWWEWLHHMCGEPAPVLPDGDSPYFLEELVLDLGKKDVNYNLAAYFPDPINKRVSAMDFWRGSNVYDLVYPVIGSVKAIEKLSETFEIVFLTHNKGLHSRSKYNCLERHFGHIPFDYVVTKEKHRVAADVLIDDRNEFVNQFLRKGRVAVKIASPYTQSEEIITEHNGTFVEAKNWKDVVEKLEKIIPF